MARRINGGKPPCALYLDGLQRTAAHSASVFCGLGSLDFLRSRQRAKAHTAPQARRLASSHPSFAKLPIALIDSPPVLQPCRPRAALLVRLARAASSILLGLSCASSCLILEISFANRNNYKDIHIIFWRYPRIRSYHRQVEPKIDLVLLFIFFEAEPRTARFTRPARS